MAEHIFYWTGVVVWWSVCVAAMGAFVSAAILAPVLAYKRSIKFFWQWKWGAEVAHTGLTSDDVQFAVSYAKPPNDATIPQMLAWVEQVKIRAVAARELGK